MAGKLYGFSLPRTTGTFGQTARAGAVALTGSSIGLLSARALLLPLPITCSPSGIRLTSSAASTAEMARTFNSDILDNVG